MTEPNPSVVQAIWGRVFEWRSLQKGRMREDLEAVCKMSGEKFYRVLGYIMRDYPGLFVDDLTEAIRATEKRAKHIICGVIGELAAEENKR